MNKKYNNVIHIFFSDYLAWLLIVSSLFVVSCVLAIAFGKAQGFIWIIPVLFLVIYCFSLPLLTLYCKTKKDIKNRNIEQITIKNFKIEQDDTFGFKNRGGAAVGKRKYRIIDENGNYYLLSTANEKDMFFYVSHWFFFFNRDWVFKNIAAGFTYENNWRASNEQESSSKKV